MSELIRAKLIRASQNLNDSSESYDKGCAELSDAIKSLDKIGNLYTQAQHDQAIKEAVENVWISVEDKAPEQLTPVLMAYDIHDGSDLIVGHFYLTKENKWRWNEYCKHCDEFQELDEGWTPVKWMPLPLPPKTGEKDE